MTQPASGSPVLEYDKRGHVAWITLSRPQALNAVNLAMRDELWVAMLAVRDDPDVRVVVIKGAGEGAFSAGADITEFGTAPSYVEARRARRERDLWGLMLSIPKAMVAAIHGYALGAGLEMSLCCDIRIASEDARLGLPETTLGYIPSAGGTQTLPRHAPPGVAREMIMTGDHISAGRALELGLVQRIVARERLLIEAEALATKLATLPLTTVAAVKRAVYGGLDLSLNEAIALGGRIAPPLLRASGPRSVAALAAAG